MNMYKFAIGAVGLMVIGCSQSPAELEPTTRQQAVGAAADRPGYVHDVSRSRFRFGAAPAVRAVGLATRYEGSEGAAQREANSAFAAYPNAGAPSTLDVPYKGTADQHSSAVLSYLVGLGLPKDQVLSFGVGTMLESSGAGALDPQAPSTNTTFLAYTTSLRRAIDGIRVAESFAAVQMNNRGEVVVESVYWPAVPTSVVDAAKAFGSKLSDSVEGPKLRGWVDAAGADAAHGEVVIHHAPPFGGRSGEMVVSFDANGASDVAGGARHFDVQGHEFRLAHELVTDTGSARP